MQKEQLSALMDGETLDSELLNELAHNPEMQKTWESYHLIRDSMRGDTPEVLHFDISSRVMAHATATLCGWTPNRNYRCGLISLIAMVKRWNNFA